MPHRLTIVLLKDDRVLQFAKQQFLNYIQIEAFIKTNTRVVIGTYEQLKKWDLAIAEYKLVELESAKFTDEFVICEVNQTLYIIGCSPRAALFGVYQFLEIFQGITWSLPNTLSYKPTSLSRYTAFKIIHCAPHIERRGFVIETIDDLDFIVPFVDWLAKNKVNELFMTFTLWDKVGGSIEDMLLDRGIDLTLGGHSSSFFLNKDEKHDQAKQQMRYADPSWQAKFIDHLVQYCQSVMPLKRISLWPEDVKQQDDPNFLHNYISFTESIEQQLKLHDMEVEVEHIAYNAGLAWDMLERGNVQTSANVDTLFAYWGRDYTQDYHITAHEGDRRAHCALLDWIKNAKGKGRKLTIFEYYSDHFMLTPLFPMLAARIKQDIEHIVSLHLDGITNLVVPCQEKNYPYQWNQYFNSYVFARSLWGSELDDCVMQFSYNFAEPLRSIFVAWIRECEAIFTPITKWNAALFPARAVDTNLVTHVTKEERDTIIHSLQQIKLLAEKYLTYPEISQSHPFFEVLVHYKNYSLACLEQWHAHA